MPLSEVDYQKLLVRATGNNAQIANPEMLDLIWRRRDGYADLELRYAYCCLDAFSIIMGFTWEEYNLRTSAGEQINASDRFDHLVHMCTLAQSYINSRFDTTLADADGNVGPSVDYMTAKAPLETPPAPGGRLPDLNDTYYQGDPYALYRRRLQTP